MELDLDNVLNAANFENFCEFIMNKKLSVHHHLGMGDHIICNGLIRSLIESNLIRFCSFVDV